MKSTKLLIAAFLVLVLAACDSTTTGTVVRTEPHALHVTRTLPPFLENYPTFNHNITNATQVQNLYDAVLALPKMPLEKKYNCPNDIGVFYYLQFQQKSSTVQMKLEATGCHFLSIDTTSLRQTDASFSALLAKTIGVPRLVEDYHGAPVTP